MFDELKSLTNNFSIYVSYASLIEKSKQ